MNEKQTISLGEEDIVLDPANYQFDDRTLTRYLQTEAGWYDYFGQKLAQAEYLLQRREVDYDVIYSERFKEYKELGATENLAKAKSLSDPDVEKVRQEVATAKYKVRLLQNHLRAWDKSHENAQSTGHFLRKEIDRLHRDSIYAEKVNDVIQDAESQIGGGWR